MLSVSCRSICFSTFFFLNPKSIFHFLRNKILIQGTVLLGAKKLISFSVESYITRPPSCSVSLWQNDMCHLSKGPGRALGNVHDKAWESSFRSPLLPSASLLPGKPVMFLSSQHYCKFFNLHTINPHHHNTQPSPRPGYRPSRATKSKHHTHSECTEITLVDPQSYAPWSVSPPAAGKYFLKNIHLYCTLQEFKSWLFLLQDKVKGIKNKVIKHFSHGKRVAAVVWKGGDLCFARVRACPCVHVHACGWQGVFFHALPVFLQVILQPYAAINTAGIFFCMPLRRVCIAHHLCEGSDLLRTQPPLCDMCLKEALKRERETKNPKSLISI